MRSRTERQIEKKICSKTRRIPRDKLLLRNGTMLTRDSRPRSPRRGRVNTNSGLRWRESTTFTATGIYSVPARQSKNSIRKNAERFLGFAPNEQGTKALIT